MKVPNLLLGFLLVFISVALTFIVANSLLSTFVQSQHDQNMQQLAICEGDLTRSRFIIKFWSNQIMHERNMATIWQRNNNKTTPAVVGMMSHFSSEENAIADATASYVTELQEAYAERLKACNAFK